MKIQHVLHKVLGLIIITSFTVGLSGCGSKPKYYQDSSNIHAQTVIKAAKKMLGVKYRYGGTTPDRGFDCSGLVQYSHRAAGINIPRTTRQQFKTARRINRRYLKAGDLVFFKTVPTRSVSHVGIYLGNNKFIHAPSSGKRVKINSIKEKYWRKRYSGAGRIL